MESERLTRGERDGSCDEEWQKAAARQGGTLRQLFQSVVYGKTVRKILCLKGEE